MSQPTEPIEYWFLHQEDLEDLIRLTAERTGGVVNDFDVLHILLEFQEHNTDIGFGEVNE